MSTANKENVMATATKIPGFVSQRDFQKANKDYLKNESNPNFTESTSMELMSAGGAKGRKGEYVVKSQFEKLGYKVEILNGYDRADLKVMIDNEWKYVEVKTAGQAGVSDTFRFNHIKTSNFDIIAFVMVGYGGTSAVIGGKYAKRFIDVYGSLTDTGISMSFNRHRTHKRLKGQETFLPITKQNIRKILGEE
jgi:hypothetical protein